MSDARTKAETIKLVIFDVDGVLTDGRLYFSESGHEAKAFDTQDGHGIKMLQQSGIRTAIITGRNSSIVQKRAQDLGVTHLFQGREDKLVAMKELLHETGFSAEETAYIGDDWPDLPAIRFAGLGVAVANSHQIVIEHADWVTQRNGGERAVRELCDFLMQCQGTFERSLTPYLATDDTM